MTTRNKKVRTEGKTPQALLLGVFFALFAVYLVIRGLEGAWENWLFAGTYLVLGILVVTGNFYQFSTFKRRTNIVLLMIFGLGVFAVGLLLVNKLAAV